MSKVESERSVTIWLLISGAYPRARGTRLRCAGCAVGIVL